MNKMVRNAVRRSRVNSEYYCANKAEPPKKEKKEKGQKVSSPRTC